MKRRPKNRATKRPRRPGLKLDPLIQFEKRLAGMLERTLSKPDAPLDPLELTPVILEHIESRIHPTGDGGREFPFARVTVRVCVEPGRGDAARAALDRPPLEERVRERLRRARCAPPPQLRVTLRVVEGAKPESWGVLPFKVEYRGRTAGARAADAPGAHPAPPPVRLVVLAGAAGGRGHVFEQDQINLGRMARVEDRARGAVRHNHLAFEKESDEVNATVSRAHAHLLWDAEARAFRVFDDGSAHGTRVLRGGRELAVPREGSRGVRLRHGDELELGRARVRFLTKWPETRERRGEPES